MNYMLSVISYSAAGLVPYFFWGVKISTVPLWHWFGGWMLIFFLINLGDAFWDRSKKH
jgi:hypothetical protein